MNRRTNCDGSDLFLMFGYRTPQQDSTRDSLTYAMRTERPETRFWVSLSLITYHFAGICGSNDVASLKKVLGKRRASVCEFWKVKRIVVYERPGEHKPAT